MAVVDSLQWMRDSLILSSIKREGIREAWGAQVALRCRVGGTAVAALSALMGGYG